MEGLSECCGRNMKDFRKLVIGLCTGLFLTLLATGWVSETYFAYTRPRAPEPAFGKVYPINVHGTVVYLTRFEYLIAGPPMFWAMFCSGVAVGLLLALLGNPFSHRR